MTFVIGQLDTPIIIQSKTIEQDSFGDTIETWSNFATVWSKVTQLSARERFRSDAVLQARTAKFLIRYLAGLTENMRISYDSLIWVITGISDFERKSGTEISAEVI